MSIEKPVTDHKVSENKDAGLDELSLKDVFLKINRVFAFIYSKLLIIILFGVLGAVLGLAYSFYKKPKYTAITSFVLEESGSGGGLGQYSNIASMVGIDLGGSGGGGIYQGDNILVLYQSRSVIEKTLLSPIEGDKNKLLIDRYIDVNNLRTMWAKKEPELKNIQFHLSGDQALNRKQDSVINEVVKDINRRYLEVSKPDKKLGIIEVKVTSTDELFAKCFNEQLVKNVNNSYIAYKTKKSLQNLTILQHQTDSIRAMLNGAIIGVAASIDVNPNLNASRQVLRVPSQKKQVDLEANKAILTELVKNLEISKVTLRKETPLIQVIDAPVYPLEKDKLGKFKATIGGGILFAFLAITVLVIRRVFKVIMS